MKPVSPFFAHCSSVLEKSDLFSELDAQSLQAMLEIYRRETWPRGGYLPPRQTSELFTVVISGRLELTRCNPETGRQATLFTLSAGDAFDVITLIDGREHYIEPVALEPLEIITAPIKMVRKWVETHAAFNRALLPYLGRQLRALENLSASLALYDTFTRLSLLILRQATPPPGLFDEEQIPTPLINTLSDEAMARMIGSVRVVVNRHIQELTRLEMISTSRGQLVVSDLEKLRHYCDHLLEG